MFKLQPLASNMTELQINGTTILFSYQTPVAIYDHTYGFRVTTKKWSRTTTKHINKWLELRSAPCIQNVEQSIIDDVLNRSV